MDKIKIGIKGHISIIDGDNNLLLDQHNAIGPQAVQVITQCLTQLNFAKSVNGIRATGSFGTVTQNIFRTVYDPIANNITFRAVFYEEDFQGVITDLELISTALSGAILAEKKGLTISKDSSSRIQIDWTININLC